MTIAYFVILSVNLIFRVIKDVYHFNTTDIKSHDSDNKYLILGNSDEFITCTHQT